jgi:predicted ATPase
MGDMAMLLLITHRLDFQPDWARHPHVTVLTLNRLSRAQSVAMVRAAGGASLPDEVVARIGRRADGVPLFVEELTRSVLDGGTALGEGEIPVAELARLIHDVGGFGLADVA